MTQTELIDAVKRWQVATETAWDSDWWSWTHTSKAQFYKDTNTFLQLLSQLDDEPTIPWWWLYNTTLRKFMKEQGLTIQYPQARFGG